MILYQLSIEAFRGIRELNWKPNGRFVCLVGPGDSTKSSILDAIDLVLSPRWKLDLDDADFYSGDTSHDITITATIGDLPEPFKADANFGLHLRGWSPTEGLHDEAQDGDESVLSLQLVVNASLEPRWSVINDRLPAGHPISSKDREMLGLARIGDFLDRHLAWSKGSALSRITGPADDVSQMLADASRAARNAFNPSSLQKLHDAASEVERLGKRVGVIPNEKYAPHLDIQSINIQTSGLTLHDGDIPVRRAGLGTRRLLTLAVQQGLLKKGGIALIDEVEHGLEPHRLRRLLRTLRARSTNSSDPEYGQLIMTTHSAVTIDELGSDDLRIVRSDHGKTMVEPVPASASKRIRKAPEALLGRVLVVCEGVTEVGFCRALDAWWMSSNHDPFSVQGVVLVDGGGADAARCAVSLITLGYSVVYLGDSDTVLDPPGAAGVEVIVWANALAVEERIAADLPWEGILEVLQVAADIHDPERIRRAVIAAVGAPAGLLGDIKDWLEASTLRAAIGKAAKEGDWFKTADRGERLGEVVSKYLALIPQSDLAKKVAKLRSWIDGHG